MKELEAQAKQLKDLERVFSHYEPTMLKVGLQDQRTDWSRACSALHRWDTCLRRKLLCCQEFHQSLDSLLLWLAHTESWCHAVDVKHLQTSDEALRLHDNTLMALQEELRGQQSQHTSLWTLWSLLRPRDTAEDQQDVQEKLHVTSNKLKQLRKRVEQDHHNLQQRLESEAANSSLTGPCSARETRGTSSFFCRLLRVVLPLQLLLLLLLLLLLHCLIPLSDRDPSCSVANNFAHSFYPMLHYTNGPPAHMTPP
ncbi:nesprin-2, partial [Austrofundulus limnaeus]|uniref:Nesprin-2 n=1 Tax=Austrofundulus limnaeus TaxID=52670 RepID=A0A2I4DB52_AUSLI